MDEKFINRCLFLLKYKAQEEWSSGRWGVIGRKEGEERSKIEVPK